ncbi:Lysosomal acid phosphatase [Echinococcus granulosus]|uniref:acid phosphatase n=1 Tax=Echinococcus granulosus TaxID=6210 RepID=W6UVV4_ECHGR|nr:Lysosomal acid phosphatase [Echinococcus granulosus]EUB62537.1 Lysosomal acid phosphatase [Echinococcus granulosus]
MGLVLTRSAKRRKGVEAVQALFTAPEAASQKSVHLHHRLAAADVSTFCSLLMHRIFGFLIFLHFICMTNGRHSLVHVHALFRHGDRASIRPHIFDGYDPHKVWPDGLGQLTQEGIEQLFLLGKWLRSKYGHFIGENYNVSTFHMRSTDVDRSLMSAEAMMAGFFHRSNTSLSKYGLHWRPVPTHTMPTTSDTLLSVEPCPRLGQRRDEILRSKEGVILFKQHKATIELVGTAFGIKNVTLMDVWRVSDDLFCLRSHNATLPKWYTQDVVKELDSLNDRLFWKACIGVFGFVFGSCS